MGFFKRDAASDFAERVPDYCADTISLCRSEFACIPKDPVHRAAISIDPDERLTIGERTDCFTEF